jgi:hypothetical protein
MDENTRRLAQFLLSDDARTRRQRQNLALAGYDTSGYQPTFGPSDSSPEQAGPEVGPMRRSPVNPIVAGPDQASFLTSEKDTRPHWETDQRAMLMPLVMSGYNNSVGYGVPSFLGGHAWSTMGDIVKGNAVHPDEIAHSANDAAGAAMLGSMPMRAARGGVSLGSGGGRASQPTGIRAYHGSPHDFDRFDMSKIGTGEGAQAYGHGLYFAENEGVAKSYRDALSADRAWKSQDIRNAEPVMANRLRALGYSDDIAALVAQTSRLEHTMNTPFEKLQRLYGQRGDEYMRALKDAWGIKDEVFGGPTGRMYEVNIKADPEQFLDWDKPFKSADDLKRFAAKFDATAPELRKRIEDFGYVRQQMGQPMPDGNDIVREIMGGIGSADAARASNVMREAGIPGIKYLDQRSRASGEGSRNYVVFDDKLIDILRKYGLAGILAGGYAMTGQEPQE